jgi:hypothetical protein
VSLLGIEVAKRRMEKIAVNLLVLLEALRLEEPPD